MSASDKIKIPELNIEVDDVDDFNYEAGEWLTGFCEELEKGGGSRPVNDDDPVEEGCAFIWKPEAAKAIEAELQRLYAIGRTYFGDILDLDITSYMYQEY